MKNWLLALMLALALIAPVSAVEVADELWDALPEGTEDILKNTDLNATDPLGGGVSQILQSLMGQAKIRSVPAIAGRG